MRQGAPISVSTRNLNFMNSHVTATVHKNGEEIIYKPNTSYHILDKEKEGKTVVGGVYEAVEGGTKNTIEE